MLTAVILLACFGILLVGLEIILPGGIAGAIGVLLLVASLIMSFFVEDLDVAGRSFLAGGILIATIAGLTIWFRFMSSQYFTDKFALKNQAGVVHPADKMKSLIGLEGQAKTVLRPGGSALIKGKSYDATAEVGLIEKGEPIKVVKADGLKLVVRRITGESA